MESKNFTHDELACPCCHVCKISPLFLNKLQELRDVFGKAMPVTSGYRCARKNAAVKGKKSSKHLSGEAVDVSIQAYSGAEKYQLLQLAMEQGFLGVGIYPKHFHFDIRPEPALWVGCY